MIAGAGRADELLSAITHSNVASNLRISQRIRSMLNTSRMRPRKYNRDSSQESIGERIVGARKIRSAHRRSVSTDDSKESTSLYEIVAQRQVKSRPGQILSNRDPPDSVKIQASQPVEQLIETDPSNVHTSPTLALLETLVLSVPLSSLHFTLTFLTHHQYAEHDRISISLFLKETLCVALPILTFLVHTLHGNFVPSTISSAASRNLLKAFKIMQQVLFVIVANIAGCYLIHLTNDKGYLAVMKNAPSIGTLWVWCIIELGLLGSLIGVLGPGVFAWYNGYRVI